MSIGKEQEEREALIRQQIEEETPERRYRQQRLKPVPEASLALTFGVLEAFDGDPAPFATSPANGRCRWHSVMRAWD
jgi:hypothetical protein